MSWRTIFIRTFLVALLFFGIPFQIENPSGAQLRKEFVNFINQFNKTYHNEEEFYSRLNIFKNTLDKISNLNKDRNSNSSALYGITKFSDLTPDEFLNKYLQPSLYDRISRKRKRLHHLKGHHHNKKKRETSKDLPSFIDWRQKGVVTSINNQKTCGACWAFSAIETIESMYAIEKKELKRLSVQQMIDCADNGNTGCTGGDTCSLLQWLSQNKTKIVLEEDYPLTLETGTCKTDIKTTSVQIDSNFICDNLSNHEESILFLLAFHGPVTAAVNALNWQNYLGGIIQFHCDSEITLINHAVQIVGYNLTAQVPHYIVRNSWGEDFGDKGYIYIAIGANLCGLANEVSTVDIKS